MKFRSIFSWVAFLLLLGSALPAFSQSITNVIPPMGSFGTLINIGGSGFAPGGKAPTKLSVKFTGAPALTNTSAVVSDTLIQVIEPTNSATGFISVSINGGTAVNSPNQFIVISTNAYVTNFSPLFGGPGTTVMLTGVNFITATNVTFNGVLSSGTPNVQLNSITVTAPTGVTTGPLVVLSKSGPSHDFSTISNQVVPSATNFFAQPLITSFSPSSVRPGTNVTISGANFIGTSTVLFGGVNAVSFIVTNNTSLSAVVPTNTSTGVIQVTSLAGPGLSTANFLMEPAIYSFSPNFGPSGTLVTVAGAGLNEKSPNPSVTVGGAAVTSFGTISPNTLSFNVPGTAATGPISITTSNGTITSTQLFYLPPSISSFAPVGGGPGTIVRINGSNFTNASAVTFNGVPAAGFTVTNNTTIGAVVPAGISTGTISVTTPGGTATSASVFFAPPAVTSFAPTHGLPGTNVTITGVNFTSATAVLFNGTPAASFVVTNNTTIGAVVPAGASTGPITVEGPGGTNSSTGNFTIDSTDIGVTVTESPNPVFVGSNFVYTIIVTNIGPVSATNVRLTNTLATAVILKSATISQGSLVTNTSPIIGNFGTINNGASATVTLTVASVLTGNVTNVATVGSDLSDPNAANNTSVTTTTVWPLPFLSITNLASSHLVQVTWPAPLSGFTLQFSTALSTNISWANDTGTKVISGTNVSVTEPTIGTARFFRLTN